MLPLFWPSFQLTGPALQLKAPANPSNNASGTRDSTSSQQVNWPINYTHLSRNTPLEAPNTAASSHLPSFIEPDSTTVQPEKTMRESFIPTTTTTGKPTTSKPPKTRKRSKSTSGGKVKSIPTYLKQSAASTPYPDSTRLASKYPLPRIKFQPREEVTPTTPTKSPMRDTTSSLDMSTSGLKPARDGKLLGEMQAQIPKGLSKLIEYQLQMNSSTLMARQRGKSHVNGTLLTSLAPSTSVSKSIKLKDETRLQIKVSSSSSSGNSDKISPDLRRQLPVGSHGSSRVHSIEKYSAPTTTTTTTTQGPTTLAADERWLSQPAPTTTTSPSTNSLFGTVTTVASPVTTTTTKLTLAEGKVITEDPIGTNKVLPEETDGQQVMTSKLNSSPSFTEQSQEQQQVARQETTTTTTTAATNSVVGSKSLGFVPKRSRHQTNYPTNKSNIKLFHFKRKPDMNKLPFYKKPLNYTELGWTSEQIQEHMDSLTELNSKMERENEQLENGSLLKRKRRGKNQFERLMAELHGTIPTPPSTTTTTTSTETFTEDFSDSTESKEQNLLVDPISKSTGEDEERVPVMRKKVQPLVMRPMFFVMNQRRRNVTLTKPPEASRVPDSAPVTTVRPISQDSLPSDKDVNQNRSKPIIRMRRKHHGNEPLLPFKLSEMNLQQQQQPWRPSKPLWTPIRGKADLQDKLMLVPSGLLTPSGSHLMPLYATQDNSRLAEQLSSNNMNWTPTSASKWPMQESGRIKPSGGLAPSGEESSLLAPGEADRIVSMASSSSLQNNASKSDQKMQQQPAESKEQSNPDSLRVPKLLVKPMRPAKYSLNGYIPKPTLNQQQNVFMQQQPVAGPQSQRPKARDVLVGVSGRDLDSSTSNEIFSRRRGLQQHLRTTPSKPLTFDSLLMSSNQTNPLATTGKLSSLNKQQVPNSLQKQMEENKRKYILQQQQLASFKTPHLSVQKANLIKAKLGLVVSDNPISSNGQMRKSKSQSMLDKGSSSQASTTSISLAGDFSSPDVSISEQDKQNDLNHSALLIGAPLNSIPKTDFECTDKKGRFVAGLFADSKTGCQVWHLCSNNRRYTFLCPTGTIFNAKLRICDWRYNVKCENSPPF